MLSTSALDIQQVFFKMTMKNQAVVTMQLLLDLNPLTQLWHMISSSRILCHNLLEYFMFVQIGSIFILGNVEDERCFSTLKFLKSNIRNRLDVHLPMVVRMFQHKFFILANFPYKEAIESWKNENKQYGDLEFDSYYCCIL
jgi:hypothetical protein